MSEFHKWIIEHNNSDTKVYYTIYFCSYKVQKLTIFGTTNQYDGYPLGIWEYWLEGSVRKYLSFWACWSRSTDDEANVCSCSSWKNTWDSILMIHFCLRKKITKNKFTSNVVFVLESSYKETKWRYSSWISAIPSFGIME